MKAEKREDELNDIEAATAEETQLELPARYKVYLLNDDYTPMDFVVEILERYFTMSSERAIRVMLQIHTHGKAICGLYTRDIAETKVAQVNNYSRMHQYPLLCTMEAE